MECLKFVLLALTGMACVQQVTGQTAVITNTSSGDVMGFEVPVPELPGQQQLMITQYLGIPYAEPPTGERRFAKPVPKAPWQGVLNSTQTRPICHQPPIVSSPLFPPVDKEMDEDCLSLSVYVPRQAVASKGPLPVMVFIHGGSLIAGHGEFYDGTLLALRGDVVVVNLNYRLGLFGFLSTGDDSAPGNYGLWDQRLAIRWVHDNIANFGGDPARVTLFGESAGAWSVSYQLASPLNDRDLFQRAIAQSGVGFRGIVSPPGRAAELAWQLGSYVGCDAGPGGEASTGDLVRCLRDRSAAELSGHLSLETAAVTVDGEFLTAEVETLLADPRVGQYDLLIGTNSQEGSVFASAEDLSPAELRLSVAEAVAVTCRCDNPEEVANAVLAHYFGADDFGDGRQNVLKYLEVTGDLFFHVPAAGLADKHARVPGEGVGTFSYYFTEETGKETLAWPWLPGAPHGLELAYIFGLARLLYPDDTDAVALSDLMMQYWGRFASSGNPNGGGAPEWPTYELENKTYIILNGQGIETANRFKADKVFLWEDYLPTITEPSREQACSYEVPLRGGSTQKPGTTTVEIYGADGETLGSVVGAVSVADEAMGGEEVAEFWGIPYARPPLGDLRFRPPEETGPWGDEPLLGLPDSLPPACPQDVTEDPWMVRLGLSRTSEDCLTLNIFSPDKEAYGGLSLPVLVVVHSGDGSHGTASVYDGVALASAARAIVVAMNYRLGALGFASTEDGALPGNYGLRDVIAALQWVGDYIGSFGGDPDRVTLLGHGGGSRLVHYLTLSAEAGGLFGRAVCMSGTALAPIANNTVQPGPARQTANLARALDCPTGDSESMLACLREKPADEMVESTASVPLGLAFPVVVDGEVLTAPPEELLEEGEINGVDLLIGTARDEAAALAFDLLDGDECPSQEKVEDLIRRVSDLSLQRGGMAADILIAEYLTNVGGLGDDDCPQRGGFRRFLNDFISTYPTLLAARLHAEAGHSVYLYAVDHEPPSHYAGPLPSEAGPAMGDELQFLFGDPYGRLSEDIRQPYRLSDRRFTLELMTYLKNFIHDGEPGYSLSGVEWPEFDADELGYASLTDCPRRSSGAERGWPHLQRFWGEAVLPLVSGPPRGPRPTCPTEPPACPVGETIGLRLTPAEADRLIATLMGTTIAALVLGVFLLGGCMAYRARAMEAGSGATQSAEKLPDDDGLPSCIEVHSQDEEGVEDDADSANDYESSSKL